MLQLKLIGDSMELKGISEGLVPSFVFHPIMDRFSVCYDKRTYFQVVF